MPENANKSLFRQLIDRLSQRIEHLEQQLAKLEGAIGSQNTISDTYGALSSKIHEIGQGCRVHFGVVHECNPYTRVYRVFGDDLSTMLCTRIGETGNYVIGVYDATTLVPGTAVFYITHAMSSHGFIIGVVPIIQTASNSGMSDWIGQGTNSL